MNMSYRKASSRPSQASSWLNKIYKLLFCIEFANNLDNFDVLVNIDEVIFSRWTKFNYTWMKKGNQNISYNSNFSGSLALIGAITSYGDCFYSYLNSKNNAKTFISFMKDLIDWLTLDLKIESRIIILIMDNSPIHTSKDWMKFFRDQNCKFILFSPYCPQFAAIELMFHILKRRLWIQSKQEIIPFNKPNVIKAIRDALAKFSPHEIVSYWSKAISNINWELQKLINNLKNIKLDEHHN